MLLFIMGCNIRAVANDKQVWEEEEGRINRGWHIVCIQGEKEEAFKNEGEGGVGG